MPSKLICVFVFAYAKCWFSHDVAQFCCFSEAFIDTAELLFSRLRKMLKIFSTYTLTCCRLENSRFP